MIQLILIHVKLKTLQGLGDTLSVFNKYQLSQRLYSISCNIRLTYYEDWVGKKNVGSFINGLIDNGELKFYILYSLLLSWYLNKLWSHISKGQFSVFYLQTLLKSWDVNLLFFYYCFYPVRPKLKPSVFR